MGRWLGVDVGTSATKAVLYDDAGRPRGEGRAATPWRRSPAGVDVDPLALLDSALAAVSAALAAAGGPVGGIGITGMGETGVLVDGSGRPVAPAIAWHDTRDTGEGERLARDVDGFTRRTGKLQNCAWSITKHRWLVDHVPEARTAVRRFTVADWVARGLGADEACERTLAGRTGWLDLSGDWDDELLAWSGAGRPLLPPLVDAGTPIGRARIAAAEGAVLTVAGHDHQAAAVGAGATADGDLLDSCGSSEALVRAVAAGRSRDEVERLAAAGITTDVSVRPGCWSLLGGTEGGMALRAALDRLGVGWPDLTALDAAALAGRAEAGPGAVWRAATEAATAEAGRLAAAMAGIVGPPRRIVVAGGWTASAMLLDAKRRLLGPLTVAGVGEAGALGAATMAARAAGALGPAGRLTP